MPLFVACYFFHHLLIFFGFGLGITNLIILISGGGGVGGRSIGVLSTALKIVIIKHLCTGSHYKSYSI